MKILMVCDFFPNRYKPYEGVFFKNHAKVLKKLGKLKVQTLIRVNNLRFGYERWNIEDIEVEAIVFFYKPKFGILFFPLSIVFHFFLIFKNLITFKPDRIILQMSLPHGLSLIPLSIFKKYIVLEHSRRVLFGVNKFLSKLVYRFSSGVFVVSSFQKEELENKLKVKVNGIIPNPIFTRKMEENKNIKNKVIFVGTITDGKNPILVLEVAKLLSEINFVIVGRHFNDSYYKKFYEISKTLKNVSYLGPLDNENTINEIIDSDFLISTSSYETFGYAIAEALSLGKPVIWTDSGGPRDFLNERNSILVKERTPHALKEAILEAYEKLKIGFFNSKEISDSILSYCSEDKVLEFYKKALES
ncbi:MAG: glycosyltransferase family 4 protein [candidate division WOR-3 bacterium]|nr:glycosyltransferase family 4 protein [candidate division WOR-3 bacterium]MDW8150714.1 glycosyltransferase family 4 protein [candidate division WOR-3 bacterium]